MQWLKSAGLVLLWLAMIALLVFIGVAIFSGLGWLFDHVYPWVVRAQVLLFAVCIASLPLAFFARTRALPALVLIISAQVFWLGLWMLGFLIVYHLWGVGWLIGGLFLGFVGVIPLAAIAALLSGAWPLLGALVGSFVVALGATFAGAWISSVHERQAYAT
ncbi:MAG: hypothetical protein ACREEB_06765 [Caulobacteraceae bacterium]